MKNECEDSTQTARLISALPLQLCQGAAKTVRGLVGATGGLKSVPINLADRLGLTPVHLHFNLFKYNSRRLSAPLNGRSAYCDAASIFGTRGLSIWPSAARSGSISRSTLGLACCTVLLLSVIEHTDFGRRSTVLVPFLPHRHAIWRPLCAVYWICPFAVLNFD